MPATKRDDGLRLGQTVRYLGHTLVVVKPEPDEQGYVTCAWPNGKRFRHWPDQLSP